MPDTQISEALGLIDGGLQLLLAAVHADDPKREMLVRVGDLLRDVRSLQAALSGHVVVPRGDPTRVAEIIAPYRQFVADTPELLSLLYDIDMMPEQCISIAGAIRFAALCEIWKRQAAPPVPEMEG